MPLSEEELRLLEQMERALVEEDPKFASTLRGVTMRQSARRRTIIAGAAFTLGITVLMAGAVYNRWYVGLAGFVLMLGAATIGLGAMRGQQQAGPAEHTSGHPSGFSVIEGGRRTKRSRSRASATSGTFLERMDARWRRRRENGGF
ncbi:DUF3040 domain-containing protein [Nocardioides sp.]|uniref:DUF3040 domain-containing protein n=1 Tax=Nocardioides sp. TaxID=35761 RepID=UPI002B27BFE7|nr:DUF3040 domain-containing protein [Nocardioides sp.]